MAASGSTALTIAPDGVGGISATLGALLTIARQKGGRWLGLCREGPECRENGAGHTLKRNSTTCPHVGQSRRTGMIPISALDART